MSKYLHTYYLPTYEECLEIVSKNEAFYEIKTSCDGYPISIFNYRLASGKDFLEPIPGKYIKAYELRGLTFVFNVDGTLYKRFLLLDKFFNVNQVEESLYENIKSKIVSNVYIKEDGSIASFIQLPNGKVVARSKASVISDQAVAVQRLYESDPSIKTCVDLLLMMNLVPVFEYVAPKNRIVIPYSKEGLILLRVRNNDTGEYVDLSTITLPKSISAPDKVDITLSEAMELSKTVEGIEGWVIQFTDGHLVKQKTVWYFDRHSLYTQDLNKENILIKMIVEETIDDAIAGLEIDAEKRSMIDDITHLINHKMKMMSDSVDSLLSLYDGDKKKFAIYNNKKDNFSIAISVLNGKDKDFLIKERVLKDTSHLMQAKAWLKRIKEVSV